MINTSRASLAAAGGMPPWRARACRHHPARVLLPAESGAVCFESQSLLLRRWSWWQLWFRLLI